MTVAYEFFKKKKRLIIKFAFKKYIWICLKLRCLWRYFRVFTHISHSGGEKDFELSKRFDQWHTVAEQSVWCIAQLCTLSSMMMSSVSHVCEERLRLAYRKVAGPNQDRPLVFSPPRATPSPLLLVNCNFSNLFQF